MNQTRELALASVFNKDGLDEVAARLKKLGIRLISTGGTATYLRNHGVEVTEVSVLTGSPEMFGDLVKTLHPGVHGAILPPRTKANDAELVTHGISRIDFVYVSIYDLLGALDQGVTDVGELAKLCDMGGPAMIASGAKGALLELTKKFEKEEDRPDYDDGTSYLGPIIVTSVEDAHKALDWIEAGLPNPEQFVQAMAAKAFWICATHRAGAAVALGDGQFSALLGEKVAVCKYGENAWQTPAALYSAETDDPLSLDKFKLVGGTEPSYNNLVEMERLLQTMTHITAGFDVNFDEVPLIALGAKHGNCCGASALIPGEEVRNADDTLKNMLRGDPTAIFGGLVMVNFDIDYQLANTLVRWGLSGDQPRILDAVIAPSFTDKAIEVLSRKKGKCRLLANPALATLNRESLDTAPRFRYVRGGFLVQPNYTFVLNLDDPAIEKHHLGALDMQTRQDILLAWAIGSTSNSNTITLVRDDTLVGNGTGQQDRVSCCELVIKRALKAGHTAEGAVAYSDSFFPFPDGPQTLANAGITTILTSSGSVKDQATVDLCQEHDINLLMIPDKLGRGFFGH